jgi:hypothetical protein
MGARSWPVGAGAVAAGHLALRQGTPQRHDRVAFPLRQGTPQRHDRVAFPLRPDPTGIAPTRTTSCTPPAAHHGPFAVSGVGLRAV